jgi:hypothetical protein
MKLIKPNYRRENIAHLFTCVIYSMEIVTKEYDCTYERLKRASKGKHDEHTLHQRTLKTCKRLLR